MHEALTGRCRGVRRAIAEGEARPYPGSAPLELDHDRQRINDRLAG